MYIPIVSKAGFRNKKVWYLHIFLKITFNNITSLDYYECMEPLKILFFGNYSVKKKKILKLT